MRNSFRRTGTAATVLVVGSWALTGMARAETAGATSQAPVVGHPVAADAQGGQVCRRGEVRPVSGLTAQARVCLRFENGSWVGSGQLVLRATRSVSGAYSWGPRYYPTRPSGFVGVGTFTLKAGETVTYQLGGAVAAEPPDTGADWEVWIGTPNGIQATGFEAQVTSPRAGREPALDQVSRFSGRTGWTCSERRVSGEAFSAVATLCVRQVRSALESKALLTYTSAGTVNLDVGLAVDGVTGTTQNTVPLAASPDAERTVTLPTSTAQARRQDHSVATFLRLGPAPAMSKAVKVR